MKTYEVLTPLKRNHHWYAPGDLVELSQAEADLMPDTVRAVRVIEKKTAAKPRTTAKPRAAAKPRAKRQTEKRKDTEE